MCACTGDIDLWVMTSTENSEKTYNALKVFGAPLDQIDSSTFNQAGVVFQIGVAPRRIDILTRIDGMKVPFISLQDLVTNKQSTGREKDKLDSQQLQEYQKKYLRP